MSELYIRAAADSADDIVRFSENILCGFFKELL